MSNWVKETQIAPQQYPMPTSLTSALEAVGKPFTDMSKTAELTSILGTLAEVANNTAQLSGNLAGNAAANALNAAVALGQQVASMVGTAMNTNVADPPQTLTQQGTAVNHLEDVQENSGGGTISPTDQAAANGMGTPIPQDDFPPQSSIYPNLEIKLRLFIPAEVVAIPPLAADIFKLIAPDFLVDEAVKFSVGGDNRGYSYNQGGYRCQAVVNISMDPARGPRPEDAVIPFPGGLLAQADFGPTREYTQDKLGSNISPIPPCSSGLQPWAYSLKPGSVAYAENTLPATPNNIEVKFEGSLASTMTVPTLTVRFRISATLPAEDWKFSNFAPSIDGDLKVRLENIGLSSKVRCYIDRDSKHDGFPAWELYVNGQLLYSWAPCHLYGPLGLFGPSLARDAGVLDQVLASVGEDVLFVNPSYHKLEIG